MYKGKYVHTITAEDVARPHSNLGMYTHSKEGFDFAKLLETMGRLLPQDVGKQVFENGGIYQVENEEQIQRRLLNQS